MKKVLLFTAIAVMFLGFISCEKSDNLTGDAANLDNNLKAAVTEIIGSRIDGVSTQDVQSTSVDTYKGLSGAVLVNGLKNGGMGDMMHFRIPHLSDCATVTVSDSVFPKEIIIDYGTGCSDKHHHSISGKIVINISDSLINPGAVKTVEFQNFYMDSVKVEYNETVKNIGLNTEGNIVLESSSERTMTMPDGTILKQKNSEKITWLNGFSTVDKNDDKFYKEGSGTMTINDSLTYSRTITTPLLYDRSCDFIVSGKVELYKNGSNVIIDYGDGTCDNIATVTTNGTTEEININSREFPDKGMFGKHCRGFGKKGMH